MSTYGWLISPSQKYPTRSSYLHTFSSTYQIVPELLLTSRCAFSSHFWFDYNDNDIFNLYRLPHHLFHQARSTIIQLPFLELLTSSPYKLIHTLHWVTAFITSIFLRLFEAYLVCYFKMLFRFIQKDFIYIKLRLWRFLIGNHQAFFVFVRYCLLWHISLDLFPSRWDR